MSSSRLIKDLPEDERPREKLERSGAKMLSDAELLAIFFGTGRPGISVIELSRELLEHFGGSLRELSRAETVELQDIKGIGPAKSAQLAALFEFARRIARQAYESQPIDSPEDVYALLGTEMQSLSQESVRVILLNHRRELIRVVEIFRGTKNECFANPAEILRPAIAYSAHSIILTHNHPSGDPSPSAADLKATRTLNDACETMGIALADHVVLGSVSTSFPSGYYSFREGGLL